MQVKQCQRSLFPSFAEMERQPYMLKPDVPGFPYNTDLCLALQPALETKQQDPAQITASLLEVIEISNSSQQGNIWGAISAVEMLAQILLL